MNEITTTISELLATSRQIAESAAARVASVAERNGRGGAIEARGTVQRAMKLDPRDTAAGGSRRLSYARAREKVPADWLRPRHRVRAGRADEHPRNQCDDRSGRRPATAEEIRGRAPTRFESSRTESLPRRRRFAVSSTTVQERRQHDRDGDGDGVEGGRCRESAIRVTSRRASSKSPISILTTTDAAQGDQLSTKQQTTAVKGAVEWPAIPRPAQARAGVGGDSRASLPDGLPARTALCREPAKMLVRSERRVPDARRLRLLAGHRQARAPVLRCVEHVSDPPRQHLQRHGGFWKTTYRSRRSSERASRRRSRTYRESSSRGGARGGARRAGDRSGEA